MSSRSNVIFFGSAGCGKSSIVNMLLGDSEEAAPMSNGALGCTFENNAYPATLDGRQYHLYDTTGLDEGSAGTVVSKEALIKLYQLLRDLEDGVSLLVCCMRAPRITETLERNYNIFYNGFCRKTIPIVIVVTGLEDHEPNMEAWWEENGPAFKNNYKMHFGGHACITSTLGKRSVKKGDYRNQVEYDDSKEVLRKLIVEKCPDKPFKLETKTWFLEILKWFHRNLPPRMASPRLTDLYEVLKHFLSEKEAREIAHRADLRGELLKENGKRAYLKGLPFSGSLRQLPFSGSVVSLLGNRWK